MPSSCLYVSDLSAPQKNGSTPSINDRIPACVEAVFIACQVEGCRGAQPKYENKSVKKAQRATGANLGLDAVIAEVQLFFDSFVLPGLQRAGSSWARKKGGNDAWKSRLQRWLCQHS